MAKFDVDAAKEAGYSPEEINTFLDSHPEIQPTKRPPWLLESKLLPVLGGVAGALGGGAAGFGLGFVPGLVAGAPAGGAAGYAGMDATRKSLIDLLGYAAKNRPVNPISDVAETGKNAAIMGMLSPLVRIMAPYLIGSIPGSGFVANKLTERAANRGGLAPNAIPSLISDTGEINPRLFSHITAGQQTKLTPLAGQEISGLSSNISGIPNYRDLLNARQGAYAQTGGLFTKFTGTSPEQKFYGNYGTTLSDIIHAGIPQTQVTDKIYGASKTMNTLGKLGLGGSILAGILGKIFGGGSKIIQSTVLGPEAY